MKIVLGVLVGVAGGVTIAYFVLLRAPTPEVVCQHIVDVTLAEAGEQDLAPESQAALLDALREQCIKHKKDKIQLRGRIEYATYARCVVDAPDLRSIESC